MKKVPFDAPDGKIATFMSYNSFLRNGSARENGTRKIFFNPGSISKMCVKAVFVGSREDQLDPKGTHEHYNAPRWSGDANTSTINSMSPRQ